jgi:ElaB/YqjD/DUF883 family membrane-anchored ribosome-binding protein
MMNQPPTPHQKICDDITQIEADLEAAFDQLCAQAGNKLLPEKRSEVEQGVAGTKQRLEKLKSHYCESSQ